MANLPYYYIIILPETSTHCAFACVCLCICVCLHKPTNVGNKKSCFTAVIKHKTGELEKNEIHTNVYILQT